MRNLESLHPQHPMRARGRSDKSTVDHCQYHPIHSPVNHPSTTVANGDHDAAGRFLPGNKAATGNPHAKRIARLRTKLLATIRPADLAAVVKSMLDKARDGDVAAARLLLEYSLGRPERFGVDDQLTGTDSPKFVFQFSGPAVIAPGIGQIGEVQPDGTHETTAATAHAAIDQGAHNTRPRRNDLSVGPRFAAPLPPQRDVLSRRDPPAL